MCKHDFNFFVPFFNFFLFLYTNKGIFQSLSGAYFDPLFHYLKKVNHRFKYKILSLLSGQLDIQSEIIRTQWVELYQLSYTPPPSESSGACMKESSQFFILFLDAARSSWNWTRDLVHEVNHHTYNPTNWKRINSFFLEQFIVPFHFV